MSCKPEARQSVLLQCLNTDDAAHPFAIDWHAYDTPFEEAGSMAPLMRHEVDLWLKTVWVLLKPFEERLTLDDFKYALRRLRHSKIVTFAQVQCAAGRGVQGEAAAVLRNVLFEHTRDCA